MDKFSGDYYDTDLQVKLVKPVYISGIVCERRDLASLPVSGLEGRGPVPSWFQVPATRDTSRSHSTVPVG